MSKENTVTGSEWAKYVNKELAGVRLLSERVKNVEEERYPYFMGNFLEEALRFIDLACPSEVIALIQASLKVQMPVGKSYRQWGIIEEIKIPRLLHHCIDKAFKDLVKDGTLEYSHGWYKRVRIDE